MSHTYSNGKAEWNVHRLWELAKDLPVREMCPKEFRDAGFAWGEDLTLGVIVEHVQRALAVDCSYPIILSAEGWVMDGNHRIVAAWLAGGPVKVVQFEVTPQPDRVLPGR